MYLIVPKNEREPGLPDILKPKNPNLGKFLGGLRIENAVFLWSLAMLYSHLVYFTAVR
jgi:hypothetical protein